MTPSAPRRSFTLSGKALRRDGDGLELALVDAQQVHRVCARNHKRMAARGGIDVHEGQRVLVLVDDRRRQLARHDLAEDAVLLAHGGHPSRVDALPSGMSGNGRHGGGAILF